MTRPIPEALPVRQLRGPAFLAEERAAASVEYALISCLIAVLAIGGLLAMSQRTGDLFTFTAEAFRVARGG